ncbi:unnamed protein product [Heligmosomoides polygyrus]|uniref:Galectin n=1 Tax=Heligmosomoides polygyrus TaxID=6339 RepID=A0A3P7ZQZ3_HELPZ|nr:unnamed protein product [Heligmosomoides polygyrus]
MPFRREIHSGCAIGTSITCTAQAFKAKEKTFTMQLASAQDIAILVTVPIAKNGQMTATARISGKYTSEVESSIFVPMQTKFTLSLRLTQHVVEIYFNNSHMLDFVHRVSPADIKEVFIEGPLIVEEVVFTPPQGALLDPLPSYDQATGSGVAPVVELQHMNIGATGAAPSIGVSSSAVVTSAVPPTLPVLKPIPGPPQIGLPPSIVNKPITAFPVPPPPAGSFKVTPDSSHSRAPSGSASTNPFELPESSSKAKLYEQSPHYVPTAFQQAQTTSSSSTPTPYFVTSPTATPAPYPTSESSIVPFQPMQFSSPNPAAQPTPYPSSSQPSYLPQPSYPQQQQMPQQHQQQMPPQQQMPHPYGFQQQQQQYPYPAQNPYGQQQYQQGVPQPGIQMQNPYYPYQQASPYQQFQLPPSPYAQGAYAPQPYATYPVMYGSGCHSHISYRVMSRVRHGEGGLKPKDVYVSANWRISEDGLQKSWHVCQIAEGCRVDVVAT